MRRLMHADLDAFFVTVEQVLDPSLVGQPVVVGSPPERRGVVSAASYEARKYGIHSGMASSQAYRLCPDAVFIRGSFTRYIEASRKFKAILDDFTPFTESGGLDESYLDVTGFESLHGSHLEMARKIKARVREETGLVVSIGIASTRIVAKVASDYGKPDGLVEVPPGEEAAFLAPLPVADLPGIGSKTQPLLHRLGIRSIGDLAATGEATLSAHFGSAGTIMYRHALGIGSDRINPPRTAKSMSRETTFASDVSASRVLRAALAYLTERVGRSLRQHGLQAQTVGLKLRYADFSTVSRQQTLLRPSSRDRDLWQAAEKLLQAELRQQRGPVRLIGVRTAGLAATATQLDMLDLNREKEARLEGAVDTIREKFGFDSVQTGLSFTRPDERPGEGP